MKTNYNPIMVFVLLSILYAGISTYALPPQIISTNTFMQSKALNRINLDFNCHISEGGMTFIIYGDLDEKQNKLLKYTSFNPDGSVKTDDKLLLSCGSLLCFRKIISLADADDNSHMVFLDLRRGYNSYTYLLIDNKGDIMKEINLEPDGVTISDLIVLENGTVLINGLLVQNSTTDIYEMIYLIGPESSNFELKRIKSPSNRDYISFGASLYPLSGETIMSGARYYNYYTGELLFLKTVININENAVIDFQKIPVYTSADAFYSGLNAEINAGGRSFIDLGDTLAFWFRLPKSGPEPTIDNPDKPETDSICVMLFDKKGNSVKRDSTIYRSIVQKEVNKLKSGDILCKTNGYPYFHAVRNSFYSNYGILSFRNYPEVILDIKEWKEIGK